MSALTDEEFERCVGDLITIASFQGEATDPAVVTVIQEARKGRAALVIAEAALLFHSGSPWDQAKDRQWNLLLMPILGYEPDATTKSLCDAARLVLENAGRR